MYIYKAMHSGLSASEEAEALGEAVLVLDGTPKETLAVKFKEQEATDAAPGLQEGAYWADLPPRERCKWIWRDQVQVLVYARVTVLACPCLLPRASPAQVPSPWWKFQDHEAIWTWLTTCLVTLKPSHSMGGGGQRTRMRHAEAHSTALRTRS
jgi:hypothetical protein